jgi:tetratricopeptide (TPR) repeat protein
MPRHPTARRVHRPPSADDDAFVAGVLETTAWARTHSRPLITGGIAVLAAAALVFFFVRSRASKLEQATQQIAAVQRVAASGNNQLAIKDLEQYLSRFGGTPPAEEARLLLARALLQEGQPQRAIETLRSQARNLDRVTGVNAAFLLAAAHEAAGERERAEQVYLSIADRAELLFQKQEALDNAARLRLEQGNPAGATQLYDRILTLTPETDGSRQVYELRAGEARAAAASRTAAPPGN